MDDQPDSTEPGQHDLFLLTQAYNRGEISLDEWIKRTREWAEAVLAQSQSKRPVKLAAPD